MNICILLTFLLTLLVLNLEVSLSLLLSNRCDAGTLSCAALSLTLICAEALTPGDDALVLRLMLG
jgi:hypothetical protein